MIYIGKDWHFLLPASTQLQSSMYNVVWSIYSFAFYAIWNTVTFLVVNGWQECPCSIAPMITFRCLMPKRKLLIFPIETLANLDILKLANSAFLRTTLTFKTENWSRLGRCCLVILAWLLPGHLLPDTSSHSWHCSHVKIFWIISRLFYSSF